MLDFIYHITHKTADFVDIPSFATLDTMLTGGIGFDATRECHDQPQNQ